MTTLRKADDVMTEKARISILVFFHMLFFYTQCMLTRRNPPALLIAPDEGRGVAEAAALSNNGWDRFDELIADGTYIIKAETIEELGEKIGAANLAATVAQYNTDCAAGVDSVFGRKDSLIALEEGPFYALYTVPWVLQSAGGVVINEQAQVVHENGSVIPGLYAVGELIGSANIDGHVTVGGFIHSMVVTFSMIAAETIAAL